MPRPRHEAPSGEFRRDARVRCAGVKRSESAGGNTNAGEIAELDLRLEAAPIPPDSPAFPSARGTTQSRDGVNYVLQGAVREAAKSYPSLSTKRVSPHVLRATPRQCTCCRLESTSP
jgi:hypothetical protein